MNDDCARIEPMADLALGLLTGTERAEALSHLDECHECRTEVATLTDVAEEVLLLAPAAPPDTGFEERVLERLRQARGDEPPVRPHKATRVLLAAAAVVAVIITATLLLTNPRTNQARAADMVDGRGQTVGRVQLLDDNGTVVVMDLPGWDDLVQRYGESPGRQYWLEVTTDTGNPEWIALPIQGVGSWQVRTHLDPDRIDSVAIAERDGRTWCRAQFT